MTDTNTSHAGQRWLTAETRETRKGELKGTKFAFGYLTSEEKFSRDALHDLDGADAEIEELKAAAICDSGRRDGELAAAQATIKQQVAQLRERHEDVVVLSDKLKFCEMDNYTKDSAIEELSQRIKGQTKKLAERDAVIAAMREALDEISKAEGPYSKDALTHAANTILAMQRLAVDARDADRAQLAADHDATVRAPLEAQIDKLEAQYSMLKLSIDHNDAEARADERRKVLEEVEENLQYATNEDEIAGVIQRMKLAAQPEEAV